MAYCWCGKQIPFCSHSTRNPDLRGKGRDATKKTQSTKSGMFGGVKKKGR